MHAGLNISTLGTEAVRRLRIEKLHSGIPFMINSKELPADQCYLEYPAGNIDHVSLAANKHDFVVIRQLTESECSQLRDKHHLSHA